MARYILALDQGTTSSRAIVFDRHGRAVAMAQEELPQILPGPGLVEHDPDGGAPVIYEDHPTVQNLLGQLEHTAQLGTMVTDFTHIKPGALHEANGGYLLLDARRVHDTSNLRSLEIGATPLTAVGSIEAIILAASS